MIEEKNFKVSYPPKVETFEVCIDSVLEKMSEMTVRELYLWGIKNGAIKRLPRKTKKALYYVSLNNRYSRKACKAFIKIMDEFRLIS